MAQCVWWQASIIGLQQGLVTHIDNLKNRANIGIQKVSSTPRDLQEDQRVNTVREKANDIGDKETTLWTSINPKDIQPTVLSYRQLDRIAQIQDLDIDRCNSELEELDSTGKATKRYIQK